MGIIAMNRIPNAHSKKLEECLNCNARNQCSIAKLTNQNAVKFPVAFFHSTILQEGQYLFRKGDPLNHIYSLKLGSIKSELILQDGIGQVTHFSLPGEPLGLDGIANGQHQVDAISLVESKVCSVPFNHLKKMELEFPALLSGFTNSLSNLLNISTIHVFNLTNLNALEKLADFLIDYSNRLSSVGFDRDNFVLPMNRIDLASYLGVKIETLSRSITQLEKINAIVTHNRQIKFLSRKPIFEFIDSHSLREKHALMKSENTAYPPHLEKRNL
jgi:CRP/FNR family transcriptional regulator